MMDIIAQYILSIVPAVTAVTGMIVCIAVGINKIKKSNAEASASVKEMKKIQEKQEEKILEYKSDIKLLKSELSSMSAALRKVSARIDHVHIIDKKE